ncbi:MAG TPA: FHIPEP family type III secretion protein [Gemmatimonadaceae bacterium]|nr:FHIPEP family type III secretion protein [Gemmatimonadaceae bacterium]
MTSTAGGDLAPDKLTLGVLHRVLQRLLNVDVPARDLVLILEAIAEVAEHRAGPDRSTPREVA